MSAQPIDVLAAIRAAIGQANGAALDHSASVILAKHHTRMVAAYDAMAALISAAHEVCEMEDEPRFIYDAIASLRAALKGAQA